ncbi:zf-HC2 domain-containing protein [Paraburkholderia jirisanensis]
MDCNDARPLLDANVDRELSPPDAYALQQHIDSCAACQRESAAVRALSNTVRRTAQYHRAPASLRAQIVAALPATQAVQREETDRAAVERNDTRQGAAAGVATPGAGAQPRTFDEDARSGMREQPAGRRWLDFFRGARPGRAGARGSSGGGAGGFSGAGGFGGGGTAGGTRGAGAFALPFGAAWRGGALALAICAALAAGVTVMQQRAAAPAGLVDQLVSSHVRAQVSGRDIDVISSDQHTVKPWFNGRIDYAPPVVDLASSGFPLAGGRLDYVGHQRVAVLTYTHRKHVIDVYVFPDNDPAAGKPGPSLSSDGYAVARWRDAGMMWWAVTDAAPEALTQLEAALRGRLQSGAAAGE